MELVVLAEDEDESGTDVAASWQILTCLAQLRQKGEPKTANSVLDHENKVFGCGNLFEVEIKRWKDAWPEKFSKSLK